MLANILHFENDELIGSKATGTIATLDWDLTIEAEPVTSGNDKAPTHRLYGRSPAGHRIDCGAIWQNVSKETGKPYLSLDIPSRSFKANLGQAAGQDDPAVQAIIPWS
ncbi:DUF736 family protein [Roseibium sp.]|uniref:DUF736 family protein n=1 Tax=Roseibium sp. TaxID=1936156 RepID=UPI003B51222E